ncbi:putative transcription factor [Camellia lanceoleosa]|uniref:Transcription factor n=1 Tax=Camellia lanceoleosa TaxID=1840588 RepID=A0ACC0F8U3_9ERIC|nr:putative transcription factor [Camellia lanceoleosa]
MLNKTTTATTCTTSASKKVFFQRLWSVDDEIAILQGIIDYTATKGAGPSAYMNAFFLFIKDSIHVNDTKTQLSDKVRKLKNKYKTNAIKAKLPSNPHDQQLYDLSQTIWDFLTNAAKLDTTNNNKDVVHRKPILKEGALNKIEEIERELKKLQIYQLQLYLRRVELIREKTISYSFNVLKYSGLIFLNLIEQIYCFLNSNYYLAGDLVFMNLLFPIICLSSLNAYFSHTCI